MTKRKPRTRAPRRAIASEERNQATSGRSANLGEQYHYVIEDLRRIAIIAAILITGLIGLSFILR